MIITNEQLIYNLQQQQLILPIQWQWHETAAPLILHSALRLLANRRATFLATWQNKLCIVKIFYDKQGLHHAQREASGLQRLADSGIATSRVLLCQQLKIYTVLILSYLEQAQPLMNIWPKASCEDKYKYFSQLIEILQQMYAYGIYQSDLHLGNILVANDQLFMIDGMSIISPLYKKTLSDRRRVSNLASLLLELSLADQQLFWSVLTNKQNYLFASSEAIKQVVTKKINKYRNYMRRKVIKKSWRICSDFTTGVFDDYKYVITTTHKQIFAKIFADIITPPADCKILKSGRTCTLFHYHNDEINCVIKRYNIKSWWHGITRSWRMTRAAHSWQNAQLLQALHITTAKPLGILQKKLGSWRRQAYLVMTYLPGESLQTYLQDYDGNNKKHDIIIDKAVQLLAVLKHNRLYHGDLKADNIWLHNGELYLLDLDSLKFYRNYIFFKYACQRESKRFLKNWKNNLALQQRFVAALTGI